jgi:histidinol phosphatase-like enzyme (inositol monophosphatase family)
MMNKLSISDIEETAAAAADAAGNILRSYFRSTLTLEKKDARSPVVTRADREAEKAMRAVIAAAFPDHGIIGEEFGRTDGGGSCTWVLDPLDGTIAFVCGRPIFVCLVAVLEEGCPILGLIDQPILGERWVGTASGTTRLNGERCSVSGVGMLNEARLATTDPACLDTPRNADWFTRLRQRARLVSLGGDGYSYGLLASGFLDLIIESGLAWHDAAALIPVIEGAGGVITDFSGRTLQPGAAEYDVIAAASADLLAEVLAIRA